MFRPHSQSKAVRDLHSNGVIAATIDNSDGLLPTLAQFAAANSACVKIDLDNLSAPEGAADLRIDPARLWLGWGDWNVIGAVRPEMLRIALDLAARGGYAVTAIGELIDGNPSVVLSRNGQSQLVPRLESERFAKDSWFQAGIESYLDSMLKVPLP